jgi:hypothetical protein
MGPGQGHARHQSKFPAFEQPHRIHSSAKCNRSDRIIPSIGTCGIPDTFGFIGTCRPKRSVKRSFSRYRRQNWTIEQCCQIKIPTSGGPDLGKGLKEELERSSILNCHILNCPARLLPRQAGLAIMTGQTAMDNRDAILPYGLLQLARVRSGSNQVTSPP